MMPRREGDFVSVPALSLGLRGMFRPDKARGHDCEYDVHINGQTLRVSVREGEASFVSARDRAADVVIATDADGMYEMLTGLLTLDKAVAAGRARTEGRRSDARRFFEIFHAAPPVESAK
jgi:hypothetical protein